MPKFEKQFVHFMWDSALEGKSVFYADDICSLINHVKDGNDMAIAEESGFGDVPFAVKGAYWKFVYYDPYYELKRAHEQGAVIQHFDICNRAWIDATHKLDWTDNIEHYRVKPMDITDYFPVGTKIVIEVVPRSGYCMDCIFFDTGDCGRIRCTARPRKDNENILFKVVEVKEPCRNTGKNEQEDQE